GQRELRRPHLEALFLEAFDDAAPAGPVGPGAMNENDVRPAVHLSPLPWLSCGSQCGQRGVGAHRTILRFESALCALDMLAARSGCRRAPRGSSTGATRNSR